MNNNSTVPLYLYHYTNTESLRKIITNRTIKFTRLDLLNDPYEGILPISVRGDRTNLGMRCVYCSCWTAMEEESVAMWEVYSRSKGVRIKMRYDMFAPNTGTMVLRTFGNRVCPDTAINRQPLAAADFSHIYGPIKVTYEKDFKSIDEASVKQNVETDSNGEYFKMNDIYLLEKALHKIDHWKYENEYRFVLTTYLEIHGIDKTFDPNLLNDMTADYPEFVFIPLQGKIEEIVLGPQIAQKDENEIKTFISENVESNVCVRKSSVKIKKKQ